MRGNKTRVSVRITEYLQHTQYIKLYNKILKKLENLSIRQKLRILHTMLILKSYFENFKQRQRRQSVQLAYRDREQKTE